MISSLPPETLTMVLGNIEDRRITSAPGWANKAFYAIMMPRLLIRTLEPLLMITQKSQLMKERKYKGQQQGVESRKKPHDVTCPVRYWDDF
ncbi:hypothetical protein PG993_003988 [Apiospora rasikravindrae]|uniref:F-box domain-containing protein n=1 Tax=Apiospora rasikravindrae TaxID=990691 RepID=A0ABR1U131_9PEZI